MVYYNFNDYYYFVDKFNFNNVKRNTNILFLIMKYLKKIIKLN